MNLKYNLANGLSLTICARAGEDDSPMQPVHRRVDSDKYLQRWKSIVSSSRCDMVDCSEGAMLGEKNQSDAAIFGIVSATTNLSISEIDDELKIEKFSK